VQRLRMMDQIFDWCVNVLIYWANIFGITYKEINVWVFVIIWPIMTIGLVAIIVRQRQRIQQFSKQN
jgi:hypothetical protein